jgi:hypothetical protein
MLSDMKSTLYALAPVCEFAPAQYSLRNRRSTFGADYAPKTNRMWKGSVWMVNWATERLGALVRGDVTLPPVIRTLRLGTIDSWSPGWIKKTWSPDS